jgi:transposase
MKLHGSARTCPNARALIATRVLDRHWTLAAAAEAAGVSVPTARKWVVRYRCGDRALHDRSSRPKLMPNQTPPGRVKTIVALRRLRMTAKEIAEVLGMALSTVSLWLKRVGLGKRSRLEPPEPPNRYERRRPGELVHVDIKQLGRISGAGRRSSCGWPPQEPVRAHLVRTEAQGDRLRVRACDDRRPLAPGLRRGARTPRMGKPRQPFCVAPWPGSGLAASRSNG